MRFPCWLKWQCQETCYACLTLHGLVFCGCCSCCTFFLGAGCFCCTSGRIWCSGGASSGIWPVCSWSGSSCQKTCYACLTLHGLVFCGCCGCRECGLGAWCFCGTSGRIWCSGSVCSGIWPFCNTWWLCGSSCGVLFLFGVFRGMWCVAVLFCSACCLSIACRSWCFSAMASVLWCFSGRMGTGWCLLGVGRFLGTGATASPQRRISGRWWRFLLHALYRRLRRSCREKKRRNVLPVVWVSKKITLWLLGRAVDSESWTCRHRGHWHGGPPTPTALGAYVGGRFQSGGGGVLCHQHDLISVMGMMPWGAHLTPSHHCRHYGPAPPATTRPSARPRSLDTDNRPCCFLYALKSFSSYLTRPVWVWPPVLCSEFAVVCQGGTMWSHSLRRLSSGTLSSAW